ncbi:MAG TPA: glycosyltransferase family 4 protein [Lysobacter sp.]
MISDLSHFVTGGAEAQATRLIGNWLEQGHEVVCLGRRMRADEVEIAGHKVQCHRIRTIQRAGRMVRATTYFASLAYLLLVHGRWADIIYTRFLGEAAATAAVLKQLGLLDGPLVATPAGAGPSGDVAFLRTVPFSAALTRLLDRHCDAINLIAPRMKEDLLEAGFEHARVTTIPNGVTVLPLQANPGNGSIRGICVGRLVHQKAIDTLILAASAAGGLGGRMTIEVIGDGPDREKLIQMAQDHGVASTFSFTGELQPHEVRRRLVSADVFLLPSRYEGMSNAALEAMEAGLPMVLTRCGGIDTYLDDDMAWIVPVEDVGSLSAALDQASQRSREHLRQMGAACRRLIEQDFDIRSTSGKYISLFSELIDESRRARS